jgi:endonuclease YncB( thermonuclease family)
MVKSGAAFAFARYTKDYVELERAARAENIGVHAFRCQFPWEWRASRR